MRVVRDLVQVQPPLDTHVTVGVFDGVHRGHQRLISRMVEAAHDCGMLAAVYTFDPHPLAALGLQPPLLLTTVEERVEVMATLGVDLFVAPPFTAETVHIRAADFTRQLVQQLRMVALWAGPDFALGYRREGTVPLLQQLGQELGFSVRVVEPLVCEGAWVNSSRVRAALESGEIGWATHCLGRPYRLTGIAGPGSALARHIGRTTFTVQPHAGRLVPAPGVYACLAQSEGWAPCPTLTWIQAAEAGLSGGPSIEACPLGPVFHLPRPTLALDFMAYLRERWELTDEVTLAGQVRQDADRALKSVAGTSTTAETSCIPPHE